MERVPEDVLPIIFSYITPEYKYNLNKQLFSELYESLNINKLYGNHSYIRNIIRNDLSFIFLNICKLKWDKWVSLKNWRYKKTKFANFTQYILYLINHYQADKCKKIYLNYGYDSIAKNRSREFKKKWSN